MTHKSNNPRLASLACICSALFLLFVLACAAKSLKPGAEKIIVTNAPAPKTCKFLGSLVGSQGGSFTGGWTSNKTLAEGAMNDLRNKAFDLGANYLQLLTNTAGVTGSGSMLWGTGSSSSHQTDVTQTGSAYSCPPADIGL